MFVKSEVRMQIGRRWHCLPTHWYIAIYFILPSESDIWPYECLSPVWPLHFDQSNRDLMTMRNLVILSMEFICSGTNLDPSSPLGSLGQCWRRMAASLFSFYHCDWLQGVVKMALVFEQEHCSWAALLRLERRDGEGFQLILNKDSIGSVSELPVQVLRVHRLKHRTSFLCF